MENTSIITEFGQSAIDLIKEITSTAYTRLPGSEGELKAQQLIKQKFKDLGITDVSEQEFFVRPKFFRNWPRLSILFLYLSIIFYIFVPILGFVFAIFGLINIVLKLLSFEFFDYLFRKKKSLNIIGKQKSKNQQENKTTQPKLILLLGGHMDSNYEFPIGAKYGLKMTNFIIPVGLIMVLWILLTAIRTILFYISIESLIDYNGLYTMVLNPHWSVLFILICTPYVSWVGFRMISSRAVCGANDNLSGIAVVSGILTYYYNHPERVPKQIEIWYVSFGSEEGGMKGSKALSEKVKDMIENKTLGADKIWVINFDSVGADGPLHIATREPMYRVKAHSPEIIEQLKKSAENAHIEYVAKSCPAGTDSAPFSRLGIPAVGILCFGNGNEPPNWHSMEDTPENVDVRGIDRSIRLTLRMIEDLDKILCKY